MGEGDGMRQKITTLHVTRRERPHDEGSTRFLHPGGAPMGLRVQEVIVDIDAIRTQHERDWFWDILLMRAAPDATLRFKGATG